MGDSGDSKGGTEMKIGIMILVFSGCFAMGCLDIIYDQSPWLVLGWGGAAGMWLTHALYEIMERIWK